MLIAQLSAHQKATQALVATLKEAVQQLAKGQAQAATAPGPQVAVRASHLLQKLTSNDIEAFERIAERRVAAGT